MIQCRSVCVGGGGSDFSAGLCEFNCVCLWEEKGGGLINMKLKKCLAWLFTPFLLLLLLLLCCCCWFVGFVYGAN